MKNGIELDSLKPVKTIRIHPARQIMEKLTDETHRDALTLDFGRKLKLEFHGIRAVSNAGLM